MAAWRLVNEVDFPKEVEERGFKKYIPMPSTWLNQERWEDEGVVARLEEAESPEAKLAEQKKAVRTQLDRLGLTGVVPEEFRGSPEQVMVSQLDEASMSRYLKSLEQQPDPKPAWEVDYVTA